MDLLDYAAFVGCENGPGNPPYSPDCLRNQPPTFDADGRLTGDRPGALVARYTYDGVGRLVRTELPDNGANPVSTVVRFDDYYDGVRRVQEDIAICSPDASPPETWTEREYVYGPDYVDEFIAQIDANGDVFYMPQDANYNVMALVNNAGAVVEQYTYEPYGALVAVDDLSPGNHPVNTVGHQGLFYDHLDGGWGLAPGSIGLYHNRNRWYSPALGRFIERDPNATALPVASNKVYHGASVGVSESTFASDVHFADGMNTYLRRQGNPNLGDDPLGLFSLGELGAVISFQVDQSLDELDRGVTLLDAIQGFTELVAERNLDLDRFAEMSDDGDLDAALREYEQDQLARAKALSSKRGILYAVLAVGATKDLGADGLPKDFWTGPKKYKVYLGKDVTTKQYVYVGSTNDFARRKREWAKTYDIEEYVAGYTKKQARAIEETVRKANPHFRNINRAIDVRHKWYPQAMDWAATALKGKKTRF